MQDKTVEPLTGTHCFKFCGQRPEWGRGLYESQNCVDVKEGKPPTPSRKPFTDYPFGFMGHSGGEKESRKEPWPSVQCIWTRTGPKGQIVQSNKVQSCAKTLLLSFKNHSENVPLPTPKMHYGAIFQNAIPKTWQECFYTNLYKAITSFQANEINSKDYRISGNQQRSNLGKWNQHKGYQISGNKSTARLSNLRKWNQLKSYQISGNHTPHCTKEDWVGFFPN